VEGKKGLKKGFKIKRFCKEIKHQNLMNEINFKKPKKKKKNSGIF